MKNTITRLLASKKANEDTVAIIAMVAVVGIVGLIVLFSGGSPSSGATGASVIDLDGVEPGTCVIGPNAGSNANQQGTGVIQAGKSVCDAQINGCGACVEHCRVYKKLNDKFGCPLDGADGFCNPDFSATDPDCAPPLPGPGEDCKPDSVPNPIEPLTCRIPAPTDVCLNEGVLGKLCQGEFLCCRDAGGF